MGKRPKEFRSGVKAVNHGCVANKEAIYIRCCRPDDNNSHVTLTGKVSAIEHDANPSYPSYAINEFCQSTDLAGFTHEFQNQNYYMVGCTGWMGAHRTFTSSLGPIGTTKSEKVIGTKIVE